MPSSTSRASATRPCGCSARPRTGSARPRRSASSRWPRAACARSPTRPARSWSTTPGRRRQRRRADAGGQPAAARRGPGAGRPVGYGSPARRASGLDPNRLSLLIAVLGRRAGIALGSHDVYANLAGGLSVSEPGLDLPLALALASSLRDRPVAPGTVAIGEVGLLGELRARGRPRAPAARGGAARASSRAIVPRPPRRGPTPDVAGLGIVARRHAPRSDRRRALPKACGAWRCRPGDARLTVPPGPIAAR